MKRLAEDLGSRARVAMLNVDDCPEAAAKMGVRGIPSILLLKNGKIVRELEPVSSEPMRVQVEREL